MSRFDNSGGGKFSGRGEGNYRRKSFARGNSPVKKKRDNVPAPDPDLIRLNKYIANSGVCSRREADTYIAAGNITVNGKTVKDFYFLGSSSQTISLKNWDCRNGGTYSGNCTAQGLVTLYDSLDFDENWN